MTIDPKTRAKIRKTFEHGDGCMQSMGTLQASTYKPIVDKEIASMNTKQMALRKLGVELEEVNELEPLHIFGYVDVPSDRWILTSGGVWYTSMVHDTWLFFSESRALWYNVNVDMKGGTVHESTEEFSYKDITSVGTSDATWVKTVGVGKKARQESQKVNCFSLKVFGERYEVTIYNDRGAEAQIKAIKNKIREKKE